MFWHFGGYGTHGNLHNIRITNKQFPLVNNPEFKTKRDLKVEGLIIFSYLKWATEGDVEAKCWRQRKGGGEQ